ncbi:MAG: DNA cytosine methyltransferase [Hyphomicrobiaceae bacterium]
MPGCIERKINRLSGHRGRAVRPRVLDLFSGCGGLSLGFAAAGFEIVTAMETDPIAARTHADNLHKGLPHDVIAQHARTRDVSQEDPEQIAREFYKGRPEDAFDVIIGGPPCQAYARIGRAKLRAVGEDPFAYTKDRRAGLYLRYLEYIHSLRPLALLMENVPDILNFSGRNIVEEMLGPLNRMGYEAAYSLINSAHHGVPQMRDRIYLIAFRKELGAAVRFPDASHRCDLPSGYMGMRSVALKLVSRGQGGGYQQADTGVRTLPPAVSASEAMADLPMIDGKRNSLARRAARM